MVKRSNGPLSAAPMLITDARSAQWSGGLLFVNVERGPEPGCIAISTNVALKLMQFLQRALLVDEASPLQPRQPVKLHTEEKDAKP